MSSYTVFRDNDFIHVYDLDDCLKAITQRNKDQEDRIKSLQEELNKARAETYKDEVIAKLTQENETLWENSQRGFVVSKEEDDKIVEWMRKHREEKHQGRGDGAIGGRFSWIFTPTSIGTIGMVQCICGETFTFRELE